MQDNEKKPALRFKGFTDPWEQRKLAEIANFSKGVGYSKNDLCEEGTPIILYGRLYTKYETSIFDVDTFVKEKAGSVYSKGGEVIVPASGETAEDISIASVVVKPGILLGGDLNVVSPTTEYDSAFLALTISSGAAHEYLSSLAQGKSVVHLHNTDIQSVSAKFPTKREQEKIHLLFGKIDTLITLHQRKYEKLVNIKKSMLDKMFPQNGVSVPEIRFKGFTDPWEQRKLGEIAKEVVRNDPASDAPIMMITAGNGFIEQSDRYAFNNAGESLKKYILLERGELAYNHGASKLRPYGSCFALTTVEKARIPFVYHCFSVEKSNPEFLSIELNGANVENQLRKIVSSGARMDGLLNIAYSEYTEVTVQLPKKEEQDWIAKFFKHLDTLITLHQRKLEKLQNIKKSCLEKMFV